MPIRARKANMAMPFQPLGHILPKASSSTSGIDNSVCDIGWCETYLCG